MCCWSWVLFASHNCISAWPSCGLAVWLLNSEESHGGSDCSKQCKVIPAAGQEPVWSGRHLPYRWCCSRGWWPGSPPRWHWSSVPPEMGPAAAWGSLCRCDEGSACGSLTAGGKSRRSSLLAKLYLASSGSPHHSASLWTRGSNIAHMPAELIIPVSDFI